MASKNGLVRCPNCGSSYIKQDTEAGKLRCENCRTLFEGELANKAGGIRGHKGEDRGLGAEDLIPGKDVVVTMACPSCGAQVVVNTDEATSVKCHWCRHVLSINEQVSNGAVPDLVLPFKISKRKAQAAITDYISNHVTVVNKDFKDNYKPELVCGVYFPYMIVDVNSKANMSGYAERSSDGNNLPKNGVWLADVYSVVRNFDLLVDDLTVESSSRRLNQDTMINANYVINTIMPFDTENAVAWDANYLRGFTSEKRDVNVDSLKQVVALQCGDIARLKIHEEMKDYDRGVRWDAEHLGIKGTKWRAAYLPVWLYSYRRVEGGRIYYVAMNGRTGELAGELPESAKDKPIAQKKQVVSDYGRGERLRAIGIALIIISFILVFLSPILLITGVVLVIRGSRLMNAPVRLYEDMRPSKHDDKITRHYHELETRAKIENIYRRDDIVADNKKAYLDHITGQNDQRVIGTISTGEEEMVAAERYRFAAKRDAIISRRQARREISGGTIVALVYIGMIVMMILMVIIGGGSGGGSSSSGGSHYSSSSSSSDWSSSYDSDWGSSSDWGGSSSYDSGGWDSGGWDSGGGFDYSYDY